MHSEAVKKIDSAMPLARPTALNSQSIAQLQEAFSAFTQMSEQLSNSYHLLENRVVELSGELASLSEQRLRELNEKEALAEQLESLLHLMPAAVIVLDNRGIVVRANPAAIDWLQISDELVGRRWAQVIGQAFSPKQTDYHEVSLKSGRLVSLETSALDNLGQLILMTDQTETRSLQNKVARQERLTAMGQMVASLAHQIRTPLSAAMLYASNLKNPRLTNDTHDQFVDKLVGRLNHLEKQVKDMLLFVKGECQLNNLLTLEALLMQLNDAAAGIQSQLHEKIVWNNRAPHVQVLCQSDALVSAFMNIINNAFEAGGRELHLQVDVDNAGEQVELKFIDNGPGMSQEQVTKIQEPFFTTKSYGTGLGIPVLMATIHAHHGHVSIESQVGQGTTFKITLPIYRERT